MEKIYMCNIFSKSLSNSKQSWGLVFLGSSFELGMPEEASAN